MSDAREIKTQDEISLLAHSAGMVDAAYYELYRAMKPGMRENDAVALVAQGLYEMGSEYVEGVNAISGERCSPHPHVFSDRVLRPATRSTTTSFTPTWAIAPATTAASRSARRRALVDAYKRCRDYLDASIELIRPGRTTAEVAAVWPKATGVRVPRRGIGVRAADGARHRAGDLGEADDQPPRLARSPARDQAGHGVRARDVLALDRRWSAARIEEEIVVTETGHEVITRFPAEELLIAGAPFVTVGGSCRRVREPEPPPNLQWSRR